MSQDDLRSYFKWRDKRSTEAIRNLSKFPGSRDDRHKAVKAYNRIQEEINERAINGPNVPGLK